MAAVKKKAVIIKKRKISVGAKYFKTDEEELMPQKDGGNEPLSWRQDPKETLSDWTIVITTSGKQADESTSTTYHVHKVMLAAGSRSCEYFATLFKTTVGVPELEENTSHITLEKEDAEVFPVMLDFLYSGTLDITTENAVALRSLARYFQFRELMRAVNAFIQSDLTAMTAATYLVNAYARDDENVENSARNLILENFRNTNLGSISQLPLELFRSLVCSPNLDAQFHKCASIHTYHYLGNKDKQDILSARLVYELTSHLSEIDHSVAKGLLDLVGELDPKKEDEQSLLALDALYKKCTESLVRQWKHINVDECVETYSNPLIVERHSDRPGGSAISLLGAALNQAMTDSKKKSEEIKQLKRKISEMEAQNGDSEEELEVIPSLRRRFRRFG